MTKEKGKEHWVDFELQTVNLGDKRLNNRLGNILERFSSKPSVSIPTACNGWSETKASYRFFDHGQVDAIKILQPHKDATMARMRQAPVILLPQDTTELDFTGKQDIQGLGNIGSYAKRRGFYLHPTLAITPERLCLGVVHTKIWIREGFGISTARNTKEITEKESIRWLESFRATEDLAKKLPDTLLVNIADREGDIYEFFLETQKSGDGKQGQAHWIIRSAQDRKLLNSDKKLCQRVRDTESLGSIEFHMPSGRGRKSRMVKQEIYTSEVILKSPKRMGGKLPDTRIRAVLAREIDAPIGEKPVEWMLLTSLPIASKGDALKIVEWYLCRWQIEIYFKIIKSGCEVEELQLESIDRLKSALAVYMIVAWRILFVTMLGRKCPKMLCTKLFDESEWKSIYMVIYRKPPPDEPPTLDQMVRMIANLGGFLNRKGDGYPGVGTIWIGIQRMKDFAIAWELFTTPVQGTTYG
jgi:hypothetical protein